MNLRISLSMTNVRTVEVTVADDITPGGLLAVAHTVANRMHGPYDLIHIQCVEELPESEDALLMAELCQEEGDHAAR
ncbi:MAG TPA: hypothetical protein PKA43_00030 [Candidatus Competibacter phosphatis]|nr:hypothetical protein [Candidatus Competibacter phosphatis]